MKPILFIDRDGLLQSLVTLNNQLPSPTIAYQ
jgi:hypothetical protein